MEERNEKIGMIMANYAELQKREDGEVNALIKKEDWNKIIVDILEWHDNEVKKSNIPTVINSIEEVDNTVVIQINGKGYIKEMMESIIESRITNFNGRYHLFVNGDEISSRDTI